MGRRARREQAESAQDRLFAAATKLFAQKGYDATSTKEICELAGVNIASLHYYFESKEKLYLEIISRFGEQSLESAVRVLQPPRVAEEIAIRLEMYLYETLEIMLADIDTVRIVLREIEAHQVITEDLFRSSFMKSFGALEEFFDAAIKRKFIAKDIDPRVAASAFTSQIVQVIRSNNLNKKYFKASIESDDFRKHWVTQMVRIFTNGLLPRSE